MDGQGIIVFFVISCSSQHTTLTFTFSSSRIMKTVQIQVYLVSPSCSKSSYRIAAITQALMLRSVSLGPEETRSRPTTPAALHICPPHTWLITARLPGTKYSHFSRLCSMLVLKAERPACVVASWETVLGFLVPRWPTGRWVHIKAVAHLDLRSGRGQVNIEVFNLAAGRCQRGARG